MTTKERCTFHLTNKFIRLIGRAIRSAGFYVQNPPAAATGGTRERRLFVNRVLFAGLTMGLLVGAVLALASGATRPEAALIGNLVASVTVRQLGTTGTASPADLFPALTLWKEQNP